MGHQFHQYQQNEQPPLSSTHWEFKKKDHSTLIITSHVHMGFHIGIE